MSGANCRAYRHDAQSIAHLRGGLPPPARSFMTTQGFALCFVGRYPCMNACTRSPRPACGRRPKPLTPNPGGALGRARVFAGPPPFAVTLCVAANSCQQQLTHHVGLVVPATPCPTRPTRPTGLTTVVRGNPDRANPARSRPFTHHVGTRAPATPLPIQSPFARKGEGGRGLFGLFGLSGRSR